MHDMEVSTTRGVDDLHTFMLEGGWFGELISWTPATTAISAAR